MEFKMFPREDVPESLRDDLAAFSKLTEIDRRTVEDYLRGFGSAENENERYREFVRQSGLPPDDFNRITGAIRFVLESWYRQKLKLSDVYRDLALLGLEEEQLENLVEPLARLEEARELIVRASMFDFIQGVGLPTVEDINIICEYRPVFEGHAYPPSSASDRDRYTKIVGMTPVIIFEVIINDYGDQPYRSAFQLTEQEFVQLRDSMDRAIEQLEVMKESVQFSTSRGKGSTKGK